MKATYNVFRDSGQVFCVCMVIDIDIDIYLPVLKGIYVCPLFTQKQKLLSVNNQSC